MNISKALFVLMFAGQVCHASDGDVRPLAAVIADAGAVVEGAVVGSGIGGCGGEAEIKSFYIFRVTKVVKGDVDLKDITVCGSAPMLLGKKYIIFGDVYSDAEIVFLPDAVFLEFPMDEYYRLIAFDGPVVASDRGQAYATGIFEPNFSELYRDYIEGQEK